MTYLVTPKQKNPCSGGHGILNISRRFFGHHNCIFRLSELFQGVKQIFKRPISIYTFSSETFPRDVEYMTIRISFCLTLQVLYIQIKLELPRFSWVEAINGLSTNDDGCMTHDNHSATHSSRLLNVHAHIFFICLDKSDVNFFFT